MRSEEMIKLLPSGLREVLQKMNLDVAGLQEIRLRAEQPAVILSHGKEYVSQTVIPVSYTHLTLPTKHAV